MLLFAHVGLTFGAATAAAGLAEKRPPASLAGWPAVLARSVDIRWLMVGSVLPDIIDKPLGQYILPGLIGTGRAYAHTLLFLVLLSVIAVAVKLRSGRTWALALAAGTFLHLILDAMWRSPRALLWPFLGAGFEHIDLENWAGGLWQALIGNPAVYIPEIVGFLILAWFGILLLRRRRFGAFFIRGEVV
jgi:inner membrane protein